jgi:hypothetical protein
MNTGDILPGPRRREMKHLKMVAVAAVAVGALMALAGASSAMAATNTALCKVDTLACPTASIVKSSEAVEAATKATNPPKLTDSIINVLCKKSSTVLHVSGTTAAPETGEVNSLKFEECETEGGASKCQFTTEGFPAKATLETTASTNGKLVVTPGTVGDPGAKMVCSPFINCTFTTASATLAVTGHVVTPATPLKAVANAVPLTSTGGLCPKTAEWDAEYFASSPNLGELYVEG